MSAAILPFKAPPRVGPASPPMDAAVADMTFVGSPPRLLSLYNRAPYRVLFPRPEAGTPPLAVVANLSGGIVAGDRMALSAATADGASLVVTTQAAEKVYRSFDSRCAETRVRLEAGPGAWIEWLPFETILFDESRLARTLAIDVAADARIAAGEMLVFGRSAHGETINGGFLSDSWDVRFAGRAVWADAFRMEQPGRVLRHPAGLAGARAAATFVYVGADAAAHLDAARMLGEAEEVRFGATVMGPVLVARWLSPRPEALRAAYATFRAEFRALAFGLPARLPTIWSL